MDAPSSGILDSNDVKLVLKIVSKNWWIPIVFIIVSFLIGYIYAYQQPDIYSATTKVLLKTNDEYTPGSVITNNNLANQNLGYQTFINSTNEINVIESYDLLKKVVDKLDINVSYFISGRLKTTEMYRGMPFKVKTYYINYSFYEVPVDFKILDLQHYRISYEFGGKDYSQTGTFGNDLVNTFMKINITLADGVNNDYIKGINDKNIHYQFAIHSPNALVYGFQRNLTIQNPTYSNILEISLTDIIPQRAVAFLDTLDNLYIQNTLNTQLEINKNTLVFIDTQLDEVQDMLNSMEDTLEIYKQKKNILDLDKEENQYFSQYSAFDQQKATLQLQIGALDDLEKYIIEAKDPTFLPPSVYINIDDAFLKTSTEELYNLQIQKNEALNMTTPKNEDITNLNDRIDSLKSNLLTYIGNSRTADNEMIKHVNQEIADYTSSIKTIPEKERGLLNIQRRQDVNEKLYEFLLQTRATTTIERAAIVPETKVIEYPRNMGIVAPKRSKIYYAFIAAGLVLSLLLVFIRVTFFDRIENIQDLKLKTHLPILGEILAAPKVNDLSIAVEDNPKSPLTESFRTLRTNLQYMAVDTSSKVLLFTSNGPGEGKTFCSINLAAILAKAEKKVLLLEFDMHKPRIGKALNMFSEKGLSTIIIGKSAIDECVMHTTISGMDTLLCGPIPPNSSELILSERVKDIITYGKQHYDYVIIDTPPLGLISDAFILMRMSDINLFVLNTRFAYRETINYVQETVSTNKIKNFGFVLNNVKRKKSKYYYNRYNYGYYGGYGYGGYSSYGS